MADIITLADAKAQLNMTSTANDAELAGYISSASQMWTRRVGPVAGSPVFTEHYDGGASRIALRNVPVVSVTSVTESWGAATLYTLTEQPLESTTSFSSFGFTVDLERGTIVRRAQGIETRFAAGTQSVRVVYVGGYTTVPDDIIMAIKLLVQHMWDTQRGGSRVPGMTEDGFDPRAGFLWPNRVQEIADAYYVPGMG